MFLSHMLRNIQHTAMHLPSHPVFEHARLGIPAGCSSWVLSLSTSSSQSHPRRAYSNPFLGMLIIVIYVYEECYAPISSLCDTATELLSLSTNCL